MDELFNYKLDALNYKERFIRFMMDNGVLKFGEFYLKSGRLSPYIINSSNFRSGSQIHKCGEFYAECIRDNNIDVDVLIGNSKEDISNIIATSMILFEKYGIDSKYSVLDSIGKSPEAGEIFTLIKDTLTSGKTIKDALEKIYNLTSTRVTNIVVAVDRMEMGERNITAKNEIENNYKVKIHSIVNLDDIISALENGVISGSEYLEALKKYRNEYCSR